MPSLLSLQYLVSMRAFYQLKISGILIQLINRLNQFYLVLRLTTTYTIRPVGYHASNSTTGYSFRLNKMVTSDEGISLTKP